MDSVSSTSSPAPAMLARQTAAANKTAGAARTSFQSTLSQVQATLMGRPQTGFASGATHDAGSLAGKTKAAFGSALSAIQSAVSIRPSTGFKW
jgi:hypothetical protein